MTGFRTITQAVFRAGDKVRSKGTGRKGVILKINRNTGGYRDSCLIKWEDGVEFHMKFYHLIHDDAVFGTEGRVGRPEGKLLQYSGKSID